MKISYKYRRLIGLTIAIFLFFLCALALGVENAIGLSLLLLIPLVIFIVGLYFAVKNNGNKTNQNLWISSSIGMAFFAFTLIGGIIDPKNKTPIGISTLVFALVVGFSIFFICMVFALILSGKKNKGP